MKTKLSAALLLFFFPSVAFTQSSNTNKQWHHNYAKSLVMKMFLSMPDDKGGTVVYTDFQKALALIRQVDQLTLHAPKIIYLVGWQYNGHDDKYPAFFHVNEQLKRREDANAKQSLIWLVKEAKKYNTIVSLHINLTDAYDDSPLWDTYVKNDLLSKNADGSLMVIGEYNNKKAYQINYKKEWESGFAKKRIDQLIESFPFIKDAGTIHIDAWIARDSKGHDEKIEIEKEYQKEIGKYWLGKGIDPTSEWVMDYMKNIVPYYWHLNGLTQEDYLNTPADILTGSHWNPGKKGGDFDLQFLFGTSMYGEDMFPSVKNKIDENSWDKGFANAFYLNFLQYHFLNGLNRLKVDGKANNRVAWFSKDVKVSLADTTVYQGNRLLRKGNHVVFPAQWKNDKSWVAYSTENKMMDFTAPANWGKVKKAKCYLISTSGLAAEELLTFKTGVIQIQLKGGNPILIMPDN